MNKIMSILLACAICQPIPATIVNATQLSAYSIQSSDAKLLDLGISYSSLNSNGKWVCLGSIDFRFY